jgi:hypothetical protein
MQAFRDRMSAVCQSQSFRDIDSMSGLLESGYGCATYEYTPEAPLLNRAFV